MVPVLLNLRLWLLAALAVALVWGYGQHTRARTLAAQNHTMNQEITRLTAERDAERTRLRVQAATVNHEHEVTEHARQQKQNSVTAARRERVVVHQAVSAHACAGVSVPDPVTERLLGAYAAVRTRALHPSAADPAGSDPAIRSARRRQLTFGQLAEWNILLLGDLAACNADKTALKQLDEERLHGNPPARQGKKTAPEKTR